MKSSILVHIGYAKTGSTFIREWLAKHPSISFSKESIGGFNKPNDFNTFAYKNDKVPKCFAISEEDLSFFPGEMDFVGLKLKPYDIKAHQQKVCSIINNLFPNARVLIVVRGFKDVIRSAYSQYLKAGGILVFNDWAIDFNQTLLDVYDYDHLVNHYVKIFGNDQVLVLPYELLKENSTKFLSLIEEHISLEGQESTNQIVNQSLTPEQMYRLQKRSAKKYRFAKLLPSKIGTMYYFRYLSNLKIDNVKTSTRKMEISITPDMLAQFKNKANSISNNELFQPYLKQYLVDK